MPKPPYHAYLLRLWQESGAKKKNWRFVLVNLAGNEEWGFVSLEGLAAYLQTQMDEIATSEQRPPAGTGAQNKC